MLKQIYNKIKNNNMLLFLIFIAFSTSSISQEEDNLSLDKAARDAFQQGQYWKSVELLDKLISIDSTYFHAYFNKAKALLNLGKHSLALDNCNRSIRLSTEFDPDMYLLRGNILYNQYKWEEALRDFEKIISIDPTYVKAHIFKAEMYYYIKGYNEAIAYYDQTIKKYPDYDSTYLTLALLMYVEGGNPDGALTVLNKLLLDRPEFAIAQHMKGLVFYNSNQYDEAIEAISLAIKYYPENTFTFESYSESKAYYDRGLAEHFIDDNEGSCQDFQTALKMGYKDAMGNMLGLCDQVLTNNFFKARHTTKKAIDLMKSGHKKLALEEALKAIRIDTTCVFCYRSAALIALEDSNKLKDAERLIRKAIAISDNFENQRALGTILHSRGKYEDAINILKNMYETELEAFNLFIMAECYYKLNDKKQACLYYKKAEEGGSTEAWIKLLRFCE